MDDDQQRLALSLYELLAEGKPVARERLAQRAASSPADISRLLDERSGVYFDEHGNVVGFWGMALARMPHRMQMDGRSVRAWCAWDTLFLPELIGSPARVESPCPTTGRTVALEVVPGEGVRGLSPPSAVLSFLRPDRPFDAKTIVSFCHFVHFFASAEAAGEWTTAHEGTFALSVEDGFEIGRRANREVFGAALARRGKHRGSVA